MLFENFKLLIFLLVELLFFYPFSRLVHRVVSYRCLPFILIFYKL